jgi:hypothetical protein
MKILRWFGLFKTTKNSETKTQTPSENYIGSLSFRLTEDYNIDIFCGFPSIVDQNDDKKLELAERFAEFLLYINEGYLKPDVVNLVKDNAVKTTDDNQYLFLENIMVFWAMLHNETKKDNKQKYKKDQPIIRPLSVFSRTEN